MYFDVKAFESAENHKYGKLNKNAMENIEDAMDGEGALASGQSEKRSDFDFVLWKASKAGEPLWHSPYGPGRPGWHIECSAMCSDILGKSVDINGGGIDLNFPHHENQLAQSEAHYDTEQWVNFFIHTGNLHIDGLKMSKSLKNFITIRAALNMYSARQLRFLFLLNQWCEPMELTPVADPNGEGVVGFKQMDLALNIERTFVEFFHSIKGVFRAGGSYRVDKAQTWHRAERDLSDALDTAQAAVHEALMDNINTPNTLLALQELIKATNKYMADVDATDARSLLLDSDSRLRLSVVVAFHQGGAQVIERVDAPRVADAAGVEGARRAIDLSIVRAIVPVGSRRISEKSILFPPRSVGR